MSDRIHNFKRRAFYHNYYAPAIYHITLVKQKALPAFSTITPDARVVLHELGKVIVYELFELFKRHKGLQLYQYVIMPDHIHLIVRVTEQLPHHLGYYIGNLTGAVSRHWGLSCGDNLTPVFEEGYNDRIIGATRSLDTVFRYLRDNPRRLAVRRDKPVFFRRVNDLTVAGRRCCAYGNLFLLSNPFKEQVVVHRADTEAVRSEHRERWLYTAANGGVLVSPFISPAEKAIRNEADDLGGKTILITNEPFGERYKPAERDFALCEAGRLLILAPCGLDSTLTRGTCLAMNELAEGVAD